jgi:integrase
MGDVALEHGIIVVRQQLLDIAKGQPKIGRPKTDAGEDRAIELKVHTVDVLKARRSAQDLERTEWAEAYDDHDLVFAQVDGRPHVPSTISKAFVRLTATAGVRRIRLHDLRHGSASLMLATGVPVEIVSKRLGHAPIAITMDTYSHLLGGVGRDAAEKAAALVPRAPRAASGSHNVTTLLHDDEPAGDEHPLTSDNDGGPRGTRTHNPRIKSPLLCQLS